MSVLKNVFTCRFLFELSRVERVEHDAIVVVVFIVALLFNLNTYLCFYLLSGDVDNAFSP